MAAPTAGKGSLSLSWTFLNNYMDNGIFRSSGIKAKIERFQQHDDSINVTRRLAIDNDKK